MSEIVNNVQQSSKHFEVKVLFKLCFTIWVQVYIYIYIVRYEYKYTHNIWTLAQLEYKNKF